MIRFVSLGILALILSGCSGNDSPPQGNPADSLKTDRFGYKVGSNVIVGKDNSLSWLKAVVAGYAPLEGQRPAKIGWLETTQSCKFPLPSVGDKLVQVHTNDTDQVSDVFALSQADVLERAQAYVSQWQSDGKDPGVNSNRSGDRLRVVNVIVTETEAPVYLVLAGGFDTLWNIQKSENARISRVAIIGTRNAGIVNLGADTPVSVLAGNAAKGCKVSPSRRPQPFWRVVEAAKDGDQISKEAVASRNAIHARYDSWFRGSFGKASEEVTIGIDQMNHAIVGPLPASPDDRLPYRGLTDATVQLARTDYAFFAASRQDYDSKHSELVTKKAQQLAGGDLTSLNRKQ
jgi:hypothetical protein